MIRVVITAFVSLALVSCSSAPPEGPVGEEAAGVYYPGAGDDWEKRTPEEMGFDPAGVRKAIDFALSHESSMPQDPGQYLRERFEGQAYQEIVGPTKERGGVNGVLVRDGYIVAEWGDTRRVDMTFSVTKSYLSTLAGVAYDRGLIGKLSLRVGQMIDDGNFDSAQNQPITWRHLLQQTSEWEGTLWGKPDTADRRRDIDRELQEPGTFWEYNDVRVNLLALCLLRVYRAPLPQVLKKEVMDPIGASETWEWNGYENSFVTIKDERVRSVSGGGHWGGGIFISTRDHARFGYLFLRRGRWGDVRSSPSAGSIAPRHLPRCSRTTASCGGSTPIKNSFRQLPRPASSRSAPARPLRSGSIRTTTSSSFHAG